MQLAAGLRADTLGSYGAPQTIIMGGEGKGWNSKEGGGRKGHK